MPTHTLLLACLVTPTVEDVAPLTQAAGPDLTWLMSVVAVLLFAISALAFGFRKVVLGAMKSRASRRDMQVIDVLPLGGKRQLAVVRCYDRTFALGLGEKTVGLVAELDNEAVALDQSTESTDRGDAFRARLESAKARLLGVHDMWPQRGRAATPDAAKEPAPLPASATQEFLA